MNQPTGEAATLSISDGGLTLDIHGDDIAIIGINSPGESQNTLNEQTIQQADTFLNQIQNKKNIKGVVFCSEKPGSFVAGADIHMIASCLDAGSAEALARRGQQLFDRIAKFSVPIIAAIDGICLGGGMELSLACHGRVCSDDPRTALGLPEVKLGLLPGAGGSQRLPRMIGIAASLDMMLTGRQIKPRRALQLGLVDDVVPSSILLDAAKMLIMNLAAGNVPRPRRKGFAAIKHWLLEGTSPGRQLLFHQARKQIGHKTLGNYPAPERIIQCVQEGIQLPLDQGLTLEAHTFGELAVTPESKQLVNVYFSSTALKKDSGVEDNIQAIAVGKIGVLGAGLMGAGISLVSAQQAKLPVRLKDTQEQSLNSAMAHIHRQLQEKRQRGSMSRFEALVAERRVTPTLDYSGFSQVDVVIEAVFEDLELKRQMVRAVEFHCPERTIFATNTSSIPVTEIAQAARRPERIVGMHYFSPVEKMPLLEVITTQHTAPNVVATAVAVGKRQGKTVIVVKDGAGFYVNRILAPYINEAGHLLAEGIPIDVVDRIMKQFGFPVGPFQLLDEVGIDVAAKVGAILEAAFGDRMRPSSIAVAMLQDQRLGKKNRRGFYRYPTRRGKRQIDDSVYPLLGVTPTNTAPVDEQQIIERCVFPMINEAVKCFEDSVIRSCRDGDIGAIFGIGFPPFRGGPFRMIDSLGASLVAAKLNGLTRQHGERFRPSPMLTAMGQQGRSFY